MHLELSALVFNTWRATHRRKFSYGIITSTFASTLSLGRIEQRGLDGRILFVRGAEWIRYARWQSCGHHPVSNRTSMKDSTGEYSYQYSSLNQMLVASQPSGLSTTYAYDAVGNRQFMSDAKGGKVTYYYDAANRLERMTSIDGSRTTFSYDSANRPALDESANGTSASHTYDAANRLVTLVNLKSDEKVISSFDFTYDDAGNRISMLELGGDRVTWSYDLIYQLTKDERSVTVAYARNFTYDANGNRLVKNVDGSITTSTFDGADQLINSRDSAGLTTYTYDANGNQSLAVSPAGERSTSTWGYENQVELVKLPSGQVVTTTYNADNRRVSKLT